MLTCLPPPPLLLPAKVQKMRYSRFNVLNKQEIPENILNASHFEILLLFIKIILQIEKPRFCAKYKSNSTKISITRGIIAETLGYVFV